MEIWSDILDCGGSVDIIYLDFAKAFDTVPHKRLLGKLRSYGITDPILSWIEAFLKNRKQRVRIGSCHSEWKPMTSGIPQGSVLGPVLFVLYINDLPESIKSHTFLFADDTKIFSEISNPADQEKLQRDLTSLHTWSERWLLRFNLEKCKVLRLGAQQQQNHNYQLNDSKLEQVNEIRDLGVKIDSQLKFQSHINEKIKKANSVMGCIRRTFTHLDTDIFKLLYTSHVRTHLEYANQIWYPILKKDIEAVENIQRRATKTIPGIKHLSYRERLKKLHLPTLAFRRLRGSMIETYKIMNIYDNSITPNLTKSSTNTRGHSFKLFLTRSIKEHPRKHQFNQRIVTPWNSLHEHVVSSPSLHTFEVRLDKWWENHPMLYDHTAKWNIPGCRIKPNLTPDNEVINHQDLDIEA
jgi:hypothetical protein